MQPLPNKKFFDIQVCLVLYSRKIKIEIIIIKLVGNNPVPSSGKEKISKSGHKKDASMTPVNSIGKRVFLILACLVAWHFSILPMQAEDLITAKAKTGETKKKKISSMESEEAGVLGVARYYAKRYNGRKTSSGAIYDPNKLTAAHPTLPLGTRVKVVNLSNDRSVIVTVNDRCRKYKTPFIDLSLQAAHQLDFIRRAKIKVRIIPLEKNKISVTE